MRCRTIVSAFFYCLFAAQYTLAADPYHPKAIINSTPPSKEIRIAIIIDDVGYREQAGRRATQLPGAVTLAVIPQTPYAKTLATLGANSHKEIMLHLPMSNLLDKPLGPGGLTDALSYQDFSATLAQAFEEIPQARGVNNHMGSLLTQQARPMQWLMHALKKRGMYFIDSKTTPNSLAQSMAKAKGIPAAQRNYFLDNEPTPKAIAIQFAKSLKYAKKYGQVIVIGHPYPETLTFLEQAIPLLATSSIRLVPVSYLLSDPQITGEESVTHAVDRTPDYRGLWPDAVY